MSFWSELWNNITNIDDVYGSLTDNEGNYVADAAIQNSPFSTPESIKEQINKDWNNHLDPQEKNNNELTKSGYDINPNLEKHICVPRYRIGGGGWTVITSTGSSYWVLPIPQQLSYNSPFQWSTEDLGHAAAVAANTASDIINSNKPISMDTIKTLGSGGVGMAEAAGNASMRSMLQKGGDALGMNGSALLKEGEKRMGLAYNPNKQLYFNGVEQRDFSLNFSLSPTSKEEAIAIRNGFRKLILAASPTYNKSNFYFTYPDFFKVSVIISNDGINTHTLMERSRLAITDVSLDLSSNGPMTWHEDGFPTSLSMAISFKESEVPTREKLANITLFGSKIA